MDANFIQAVITAASDNTDAALAAAAIEVWPSTRPKGSRAPNPFCALAQNGANRRTYKAPCAPEFGTFGSHAANYPQTKGSMRECAAIKSAILGKLRNAYDLAQAHQRG